MRRFARLSHSLTFNPSENQTQRQKPETGKTKQALAADRKQLKQTETKSKSQTKTGATIENTYSKILRH